MRRAAFVFVCCCALSCKQSCGQQQQSATTDAATTPIQSAHRPPRTLPPGFLKGQLHAHSSGSQDSKTSPAAVHRWYEEHGADFVVFTDHNWVTDTPDTPTLLTIAGAELTRNLSTCDPPPPPHGKGCALHMNALFVTTETRGQLPPFEDPPAPTTLGLKRSRRDVYQYEFDRTIGLGGIPMINHPNLQFTGPDEATLMDLSRQAAAKQSALLVEIENKAWDSENEGDGAHISTEALWDSALAHGARVFATATDDAHHYYDAKALREEENVRPFDGDHGYVIVRAEMNVAAIRAAIIKGDFYASTGLVFAKYDVTADSISAVVQLPKEVVPGPPVTFEVIADGKKVREQQGTKIDVHLDDTITTYIRIRARRGEERAWSQPLFRKPRAQ